MNSLSIVRREFNGVRVAFEGKEKISLTDLWRASGANESQDPRHWTGLPETVKFINTVSQKLNVGKSDILKSIRGRNGGTWAHWQIALAYAKYLSPELHFWCNQVVKERIEEEYNPELAITRSQERAIKAWKRQGKTDEWIEARLKGISVRKTFTKILARHGVNGQGYAQCTNAIYEPILGNKAAIIREEKGLKPAANVRDNIGNVENIGIMLAEALAGEKINIQKYHGNEQCTSACATASLTVAKAIKESRETI